MQPTPVLLPGKSHGQVSLANDSPWSHKSWTQRINYTTTGESIWRWELVKFIRSWEWNPHIKISVFTKETSESFFCCCFLPRESVSLSPIGLFVTPWTLATRFLCPWNSPGKNTGVGCIPFFRGFSQPRDWTQVSCIADRFFTRSGGSKIWILESNKNIQSITPSSLSLVFWKETIQQRDENSFSFNRFTKWKKSNTTRQV